MSAMSRRKGKRGELHVAERARAFGFTRARRGAPLQAAIGGSDEAADVINVGRLWAEVRFRERTEIDAWMREVLAKERPGFIRVCFHKRNGGPLLATLEADELFKLEACHFPTMGGGRAERDAGGPWQALEDHLDLDHPKNAACGGKDEEAPA